MSTSGPLRLALLSALTVAWAWASAPAAGEVTPERLLERAFRHPRSVAHSGIVRVTMAGSRSGPALVRVICDGRGRERREHLDGPVQGLVVVTDGRSTWQRWPGTRTWTVLPPTSAAGASWERLRTNYRIRSTGRQRVAGRDALSIEVAARQPGNPRQVIWVDVQSGLVLRSDSYRSSGALAIRSAYVQLELGLPPSGAVALPRAGALDDPDVCDRWEVATSLADLEQRLGYRVALPTRLPPGYAPDGYYARGCRRVGKLPVVRYGDGLNTLTLFVTPECPGGGRGRGRRWRGGRGAQAPCVLEHLAGQGVARRTLGGYTYILVGDHDPRALAEALSSLQ